MKKRLLIFLTLSMFLTACASPSMYEEPESTAGTSGVVVPEEEISNAYFYGLLSNKQKELYKLMYGVASNGETHLDLDESKSYKSEEIEEVSKSILYDKPELFWYTGELETFYYEDSGIVNAIDFKYNMYANDLENNIARFNAEADKIITQALKLETATEREKLIHDYVCENVTYKKGDLAQSAYTALVNKEGVCAAYANLFAFLMNKCGVPCYVCGGVSLKEGHELHAWNIIKLGDEYYNVDPTWDDSEDNGTVMYSYYNVPDAEFNKTHERDETGNMLPMCNGTDYTYEKLYNQSPDESNLKSIYGDLQVIDSVEEFYERFRDEIAKSDGPVTFSYYVFSDQLLDDIQDACSNLEEIKPFLKSQAEIRGWSSYRISSGIGTEYLKKPYYYVTQTVDFSE